MRRPRASLRALPARSETPATQSEATQSGVERVDYRRRSPSSPRTYVPAAFVALAAGALIALTWLAPAQTVEAVRVAAEWAAEHQGERERAALTTALVAVALLGFAVAWGRATALRRPVRLADGRGTIAVDEVEARLRAAFLERPDVRAARVEVENRHRRGLAVRARLAVSPDARLASTVEGATALAERLVHEELGVRMTAPPSIELHYDELDLRAGRADARRPARGLPPAAERRDDRAGAA